MLCSFAAEAEGGEHVNNEIKGPSVADGDDPNAFWQKTTNLAVTQAEDEQLKIPVVAPALKNLGIFVIIIIMSQLV